MNIDFRPTMSTTEVKKILEIPVSVDDILKTGVEPATVTAIGHYWFEHDLWRISRRLGDRLTYRSAELHLELKNKV